MSITHFNTNRFLLFIYMLLSFTFVEAAPTHSTHNGTEAGSVMDGGLAEQGNIEGGSQPALVSVSIKPSLPGD